MPLLLAEEEEEEGLDIFALERAGSVNSAVGEAVALERAGSVDSAVGEAVALERVGSFDSAIGEGMAAVRDEGRQCCGRWEMARLAVLWQIWEMQQKM